MKVKPSSGYVLLVVTAGVLWGTTGIFARAMGNLGFYPIQLALLKAAVPALLLGLYLVFFDRAKLRIRIKDLWMFIGTGILSFLFFNLCYLQTIRITSAAVAVILLYTSPVFVFLMSFVLFKEPISKKKLFALGLSILGCVLVSGIGQQNMPRLSVLTFLVGIGAGFCFALYSVFGRICLRKYPPLTVIFYTFLFAALGLVPFIRLGEIMPLLSNSPSPLWAMGLGIITCLLPYLLYTKGLSGMDTGKASICASTEPIVGSLISVFIFLEPLSIASVLGIALIISAIILLNLKKRNALPNPN